MATPAPHALLLHIASCDALIAHHEHHLITITKQLHQQEAELEAAEAEHSSMPKKLMAMKKAIDDLELELRTIDDDLKHKNRQLDVITAEKQLRALEHEIAMLTRKKETLNDLQVDQWLAYETVQHEQVTQSPAVDNELEKRKLAVTALAQDIEQTKIATATAQEELLALINILDDHWLPVYQRMKIHIPDPIVLVQKDSCGGCFYPLQAQMLIKLRHSEVITCTLCNRLLVYAPPAVSVPTTSH